MARGMAKKIGLSPSRFPSSPKSNFLYRILRGLSWAYKVWGQVNSGCPRTISRFLDMG
jgi:hypothetical protein